MILSVCVALDRDAGKAVGGQQQIQQQYSQHQQQHQQRLPDVGAKYKPQRNSPNKRMNGPTNDPYTGGTIDVAEVMERLNQFGRYMQANDDRLRHLEVVVRNMDNNVRYNFCMVFKEVEFLSY
jgi:hypothetical protein